MARCKISFLSIEELQDIAGIGQTIAMRIAILRKEMGYKLTMKSLAAAKIRSRPRARDECDLTPFNGDAAVFAGEKLDNDDDDEDEEEVKRKQKVAPIPKRVTFSGKENWNGFKTKFNTFISNQDCCEETKLAVPQLSSRRTS